MFKFLWKLSENLGMGIFLLILLLKLPSSLLVVLIFIVGIWFFLKPAQGREGCRCGRSRGRCRCSR